jgi:hypothetical protein
MREVSESQIGKIQEQPGEQAENTKKKSASAF